MLLDMGANEMVDGSTAQAMFEQACRDAAGDPEHTPQVDLTRPAKKSPTAAERATWRSEAA